MAIEFVGGTVAAKAGAASGNTTIALNAGLTGGIASAVSAGDLVIAAFAVSSSGDTTLVITDGTTNYTLIDSELFADDNSDTNLRVAYKFMGGTPDTDTTFGPTNNAAWSGAMAVYVFRGVDSTTPLDVAAVPATGIDSGIPNPAGITPTTAGAFIAVVGASAHTGATDTFTSSDLTDFQTIGQNDSIDVSLGIGHKPDWTSGEFNPAAFGFTQLDNVAYSWAAMSIALRPEPAPLSLVADAGSYALTGTAATPEHGWKVAAGGGSYALTGTDATMARGQKIVADAGSYSLSGTDATLRHAWKIVPDAGSYALSGTDASLELGRKVTADGGTYALTGTDATLTKSGGNKTLAADAGSYSLTGTNASLVVARKLVAANGNYALTGTDATLTYVPVETRARGGDDGGSARPIRQRRRIRPEEIIAIIEAVKAAEEEAKPRPTAKKRKALARKIIETIDDDNIFTQALKKPVAQFVRQEVAQVYQPGVSWSEVHAAVTRIIEAAQAEARRIEQEIEDEDEFLILMAA
jgi:hypothetical protein